jgi:hypothetical protein
MMILKRRGIAVTDEQEGQLISCTDPVALERWLDRAFSVASVEELLA